MDIQFYGANCLTFVNKQTRIVVDDNLSELGGKSVTRDGDIALFTGPHGQPSAKVQMVVDQPGEYELGGISIYGIAMRSHVDEEKQKSSTMYKLIIDDMSMLITGHVYPDLNDNTLETIGMIDVMFVPVGGSGYTLDATGALILIKKIEPKLVIPTHYADSSLSFPVPQVTLEDALKNIPIETKETLQKLRVKPTDLTDVTQLVVLEKS